MTDVGQLLWDLGPMVEESEVEHTITCHASQLADHYRSVCAKVRLLVEERERIERALRGWEP